MAQAVVLGFENVSKLASKMGRCLLLYSGGVDGTHFLLKAQQAGIKVLPLTVMLDSKSNSELVEGMARKFAGDAVIYGGLESFVNRYVSRAILSNAIYNGYPISASLSRPMLAEVAVEVAEERELTLIVHTSSVLQNSISRITNSIRSISKDIVVGLPNIFDQPPRREKLRDLASVGWNLRADMASHDRNIWCSELESLPNSDSSLNLDFRYRFFDAPENLSREMLRIEFSNGLPVGLGGHELPLHDLIEKVAERGKAFNIGYFTGFEPTPLGRSRLEVRHCPAAAILLKCHQVLESATLTEEELRVKEFLDREWTQLALVGKWFSPLKNAIDRFIDSVSSDVSGAVEVELSEERFEVIRVDARKREYLSTAEEERLTRGLATSGTEKLLKQLLFNEGAV